MDAFMVNKRVLMIAYHYPPMRGSSGIQRTLKFSHYLPQSGWGPVMLSAHPRAYANPGDDQMGDIPSSVPVTRAFALDTARHLAIGGRYAGFMALPDRWASCPSTNAARSGPRRWPRKRSTPNCWRSGARPTRRARSRTVVS